MLRVENFLESGVGCAEQRTKPGVSFMVAQGHCIPLGIGGVWLLLRPLRGFLGLFPSVGAMDCLSWLDGGALVQESLWLPFSDSVIFWHSHLVKIFQCTFVTQLVAAQLL